MFLPYTKTSRAIVVFGTPRISLQKNKQRLTSSRREKAWRNCHKNTTSRQAIWIDSFILRELRWHGNAKLYERRRGEKRPSPLSEKSIVACKLFDFVFEAFPRLHRAKGPNRKRQALFSDKERVDKPACLLHTTDQSHAQDSANLQHHILLRDKLVTDAVILATVGFNLQCNNVARQVEGKCCPYYRTLIQTRDTVESLHNSRKNYPNSFPKCLDEAM